MASLAASAQYVGLRACTVSRDVQNFDLLIEDMEMELGEDWGDLSFANAMKFLDQPEARKLEFLAVALDDGDTENMPMIEAVVQRASALDISVLLIAEELGPIVLHRLLRLGATDFVPYPLPEGALHDAIKRLEAPAASASGKGMAGMMTAANGHNGPGGSVYAIQRLGGGVGATTLAVNLAWELATMGKNAPKVCLIDFDLQMGSVSTYLDLARTEKVYELLSNTAVIDRDFFLNTLQTFNGKLQVLTAAADMLPLDLISADDIERVIAMARANFDVVIIDMPGTVVQWTETVFNEAAVCFAMMELDMRSAQNALRLIRALKAEALPLEKMRYILNRAPKFTDLSGKARAKRMAESLDIEFEIMLPDGTAQVTHGNDHGLPLADVAPKNPLLKEIRKMASAIAAECRLDSKAAA